METIAEDERLARVIMDDEWIIVDEDDVRILSSAAFPADDLRGKDNRSVSVFRADRIKAICLDQRTRTLGRRTERPAYATATAGDLMNYRKEQGSAPLTTIDPSYEEDDQGRQFCVWHADIRETKLPEKDRLDRRTLRMALGKMFSTIHYVEILEDTKPPVRLCSVADALCEFRLPDTAEVVGDASGIGN